MTSTTNVTPVEGDWSAERFVIVEFPSAQRAREWYRSPEYATALAVRWTALERSLLLVDDAVHGAEARTAS